MLVLEAEALAEATKKTPKPSIRAKAEVFMFSPIKFPLPIMKQCLGQVFGGSDICVSI